MTHWFEYFPGHHMGSQGMMFAIEMAAQDAAALGEIDQVGSNLVADWLAQRLGARLA